jgi:peptidoglycan/LPS O-acetylase OafA/YrhL
MCKNKIVYNGSSATGSRISVLDGWRTISVTLVILSHLLLQSNVNIKNLSGAVTRNIYLPLLEGLGYLGVDIFFVISGFVICRGFRRELEAFGRISLPAFYVRRSFRILPPLLIYVGVILGLSLLNIVDGSAVSVYRALTFTCNFPNSSCGGWLGGHTWSLSVEEQFYLAIPVIFSLFREVALKAVTLILPVIVVILELVGASDAASFLCHFCVIGIGVACAISEGRIRDFITRLPKWLFYAAIILLIVLARLHSTREPTLATIGIGVVAGYVLMMSMNTASNSPSITKTLLSGVAMQMVGRASYALYLWQQLATYPFGGVGTAFYIMSICCCFLVIFASYRWIEQPLIRIGATVSRRLQSAGVASKS